MRTQRVSIHRLLSRPGVLLSSLLLLSGFASAQVPQADLVITDFGLRNSNPTPGTPVTFFATVKNQGTARTPSNTWVSVRFYIDGVPVCWASAPTGWLGDGNSTTLVANDGPNGVSTWTATPGTHTLLAYADAANRIPESNKDNNTATLDFTVTSPSPASTLGQWSPVYSVIPARYNLIDEDRNVFVGIHLNVLPNGKLFVWGRDPIETPENATACAPSLSYIWDPAHPTAEPVVLDPAVANTGLRDCIFCAGHCFLPDGRLLVAGGHISDGAGLNSTYIFDYRTNFWTKVAAPMNRGRWYPTTTALADGTVLVAGGTDEYGYFSYNAKVQILDTRVANPSWRTLNGVSLDSNYYYYPWLFVAPNGKLFFAGPTQYTGYVDLTGEGSFPANGWTARTNFNGVRVYGTAVQYDDGKIFIAGGATSSTEGIPTATAEVIDLNAGTPAWRSVAPMQYPRIQCNGTVLPDGTILVTGGTSGANNSAADAVYAAELWNPQTETFTTLASAKVPRLYHSAAVLLADGTVVSGGGGLFPFRPVVTAPPYNVDGSHPDLEIFSPPYLFRGARPTIAQAPSALSFGQTFSVQTPDAANISKVTMVRLSTCTHSFNENQRFNRLNFTIASSGLTVTAPANGNLCPPGDYFLFILNRAGVPSVGTVVNIH